MEEKELKVNISCEMRRGMKIFFIAYEIVIFLLGIMGFVVGQEHNSYHDRLSWWFFLEYKFYENRSGTNIYGKPYLIYHNDFYPGNIFLAIFIILFLMVIPAIALLIENRRRKLTELTANEKEIIGSYTAFIPISKLALKMPIDKVDNITVVNSKFYWFTGKMIRIASTSGVIKIPYVLNANEVVAYISEAIETAKKSGEKTAEKHAELPQGDAADTLKKIADLRDAGIITEEEFEHKKKEILGKM